MGKLHVLNGRLTAAVARLRGWRHFPPEDSAELIEVAEALEERGDPYTRDELRLLDLGERLALLTRSRPKAARPPSPFDERIAETEAELAPATDALEAAQAEHEAALAAGRDAVRRLSHAKAAGDRRGIDQASADIDAASVRATQAHAALLVADQLWLRQRSRLTSLQLVRDRWHAEQTSMVRGPGGRIMTLAEFGQL